MKALIFYALLEQFFIELNQLIPLPNWSNLVFLQYKYNKNSFIGVPCSCVENNLRVRKTFAMALFWKILLPSFLWKIMRLDKKSSQNPLKQLSSPKIQARFGFSMPKNHIYSNSLFGSVTEFEFSKFCAFWVVCPFSLSGQLRLLSYQQQSMMVSP